MSAQPQLQTPTSASSARHYSEADYLTFDEAAEGRWEFMNGQIIPVGAPEMANVLDPTFRAGATPAHYDLARVLGGLLFNKLPSQCRAFTSDARVYIPSNKSYTYPDIVIVCGESEYQDPEASLPSLTNPVVIIEILSESTEAYDRFGKFVRYRSIPSLQQYLMVDSRRVGVELLSRQADDNWTYISTDQPDDIIDLHSVSCQLSVREIYDRITLAG